MSLIPKVYSCLAITVLTECLAFVKHTGRHQHKWQQAFVYDDDSLQGYFQKELRIQYKGEPWRVLFAFDPHRQAILLVGGNKSGNKRWYKENIPIADQRYQKYLEKLKEEKS